MTNPPAAPIAWHCLLGEVLEKLLSPVGLLVYTELAVMNKPPKADILIIRREQATWTEPTPTAPTANPGVQSEALSGGQSFALYSW